MTRLAILLQRLSEMGKLCFIVTHDYELVCRTCTRVLHLDEGAIRDDLPMTAENLPRIQEIFHVR